MSVEESTVIFGPIFQVGWASASSTRHRGRARPGVRPRNGPARGGDEQAGHAERRAGTGPSVPVPRDGRRHWWMAQCSESTGTISAPGVGPGPLDHRGAGDQRLLVGQGEPAPGFERGQRDRQPGEARPPR